MQKTTFTRKKFFAVSGIAAAGVFLASKFSFVKKLYAREKQNIQVSINPLAVKRESRGKLHA